MQGVRQSDSSTIVNITNLIDRNSEINTHEIEQINEVLNEKWYDSRVQRELINRYDVLTNTVLRRAIIENEHTKTNLIDRNSEENTYELNEIEKLQRVIRRVDKINKTNTVFHKHLDKIYSDSLYQKSIINGKLINRNILRQNTVDIQNVLPNMIYHNDITQDVYHDRIVHKESPVIKAKKLDEHKGVNIVHKEPVTPVEQKTEDNFDNVFKSQLAEVPAKLNEVSVNAPNLETSNMITRAEAEKMIQNYANSIDIDAISRKVMKNIERELMSERRRCGII